MNGRVHILTLDPPSTDVGCAKRWLRVWHQDDDQTIAELIGEAYSEFERTAGRMLRPFTAELTLDSFPDCDQPIVMPLAPLTAVSSIAYTDASGTDQTITDAQIETHSLPGEIRPAAGSHWPDTQPDNSRAVRISYSGGAVPDASQREIAGCVKLMLDLAYHENSPQVMSRLVSRRDAIIRRWRVRDRRLAGITYN